MGSINLAVFILSFITYIAAAGLLSRTVGTIGQRTASVPNARRVVGIGRIVLSIVAIGCGYALYIRYPLFEPLAAAFPSGPLSSVAALAERTGGMGLVALTGVYAVNRALKPTVTEIFERDHTVEPRYRRRKWLAIAVISFGLAGAVAVLVSNRGSLPRNALFPIALATLVVAGWLSNPYQSPFVVGTRDPTPTERRRLERCYERFDRTPGKIVVAENNPVAAVFEAGRGASRWTWIREGFLEAASDEELAVVLAQSDEKIDSRFWEFSFFAVFSLALVLLMDYTIDLAASVPVANSRGLLNAGTVVLVLLLFAPSRRCTYRADDFASTHFGSETVREVYLTYPESIGYGNRSLVWDVFGHIGPEPLLERRIDRLTERYSLDPLADISVPTTRWTTLIAVSTGIWSFLMVVYLPVDLITGPTGPWLFLLLWLGVPLGIYLDSKTTKSVTGWPSDPKSVVLASAVPVGNILVGCWYLGKRRRLSFGVHVGLRTIDESEIRSTPRSRHQQSTDSPTITDETAALPIAWLPAIVVCTAGTVVLPIAAAAEAIPESVGMGLFVLLWAGFPLVMFMDTRTTRARAEWPTYPRVVTLMAAIPYVNVLVGVWYLRKRRHLSIELSGDDSPA